MKQYTVFVRFKYGKKGLIYEWHAITTTFYKRCNKTIRAEQRSI